MNKDKKEFLLAMYKELFNNVDRHISLSWQSVSVIASFLAAIMLTERFGVPSIITVSVIIIIAGWTIARLIDAEHWYDRNIHIISNIEKLFLSEDEKDDKNIHFYFKKNRTRDNRLESVTIQIYGTTLIWLLAIVYSMWRVPKNIEDNMVIFNTSNIYCESYFLIIISGIVAIILSIYKHHTIRALEKLRKNSPGLNCEYEDKKPWTFIKKK